MEVLLGSKFLIFEKNKKEERNQMLTLEILVEITALDSSHLAVLFCSFFPSSKGVDSASVLVDNVAPPRFLKIVLQMHNLE